MLMVLQPPEAEHLGSRPPIYILVTTTYYVQLTGGAMRWGMSETESSTRSSCIDVLYCIEYSVLYNIAALLGPDGRWVLMTGSDAACMRP